MVWDPMGGHHPHGNMGVEAVTSRPCRTKTSPYRFFDIVFLVCPGLFGVEGSIRTGVSPLPHSPTGGKGEAKDLNMSSKDNMMVIAMPRRRKIPERVTIELPSKLSELYETPVLDMLLPPAQRQAGEKVIKHIKQYFQFS